MNIKRIIYSIAVGAFIVGAIPQQQAIAQVLPQPVTITIDENGHADSSDPSLLLAPTSVGLQNDQTGGIAGLVLQYNLGADALPGEVGIQEPGATVNLVVSDVIRFVPVTAGLSRILFYSDTAEADAIADTGLPTQTFGTNPQTLTEVGTEGDNGVFYRPSPNQPGFITGQDVTYHFISEVPETNTIVAGFAVAGLVAFQIRLARSRKA